MAPYSFSNPAPNPVPTAESGPKLLENAAWLDVNWMFIGTFFCPIALLVVCCSFSGSLRQKISSPYLVGWLTVVFYLVHQTEEHAYDIRGWRYAFVPGFNHGVGALLFQECKVNGHISCPLDPRMATYVNVPAIWIGFSLTMVVAHYLGGPYAYAGLCNWGVCIVNAAGGHLLPWILQGYNPGAVQSIFMFAFGVFAITREGPKLAVACIISGVIFHIISFGIGMNLILKVHFPKEGVGILCFLTAFALPLMIARFAAPQSSKWYEKQSDEETAGE